MVEIFILGCIYAHPAYRDLMMNEGPYYIAILSEGQKSMFPQATYCPLTRKIFVAKNDINICLGGQICYLMCTGPLCVNSSIANLLTFNFSFNKKKNLG